MNRVPVAPVKTQVLPAEAGHQPEPVEDASETERLSIVSVRAVSLDEVWHSVSVAGLPGKSSCTPHQNCAD